VDTLFHSSLGIGVASWEAVRKEVTRHCSISCRPLSAPSLLLTLEDLWIQSYNACRGCLVEFSTPEDAMKGV